MISSVVLTILRIILGVTGVGLALFLIICGLYWLGFYDEVNNEDQGI